MPSWPTEVLRLLGFTTPFIYAAAVFGLFNYLDKKASGPAKAAISKWLQSKAENTDTLGNAALEMFNRIYTPQLWSWQACIRSALFTLCMSAIFLYEFYAAEDETYKFLFMTRGLYNSF